MPRKNPRLEDYNQRVGSHKDYYGDILLGVFIGAWITLCFGILVFGLVVEGLIS